MEGLIPGRIVYFVFDVESALQVKRDRFGREGNPVNAGDIYPAMVVRVWDQEQGLVNLRVFLDGPDVYWVTSVKYDGMREVKTWHWLRPSQAPAPG
jgi:hypothetical protein